MHFCMTGQYTPKALNSILENPKTNRYEAAKKLVEQLAAPWSQCTARLPTDPASW